jgi:thymidylate synthase (FAD)
MKIIEPSFEILRCPSGEEALSFLERVGRTAYQSEDKIDDGFSTCPTCAGNLYYPIPEDRHFARACPTCAGLGRTRVRVLCPYCHGQGKGHGPENNCPHCDSNAMVPREPSSHKFVRMILRADRAERLANKGSDMLLAELDSIVCKEDTLPFARKLVEMVLTDIRENPPHLGILEHLAITVRFTSNRGFTHELVRHRMASHVQESTRYCNYGQGKFGSEITVTQRDFEDLRGSRPEWRVHEAIGRWMLRLEKSEESYLKQLEDGSAPEIARDHLPNALKASIVTTANLAEWRHILRLRTSPRAHPDMRALMQPLLEELRKRIPIVFEEL